MTKTRSFLSKILLAEVSSLRIAVAIGAFCFSLGLLFGDAHDAAYIWMHKAAPLWVWSVGFFLYGVGKLYIAVHWPEGLTRQLVYVVILSGLFLWIYVWLSFIQDGASSAEYMMFSLILAEIWIGAHTLESVRGT